MSDTIFRVERNIMAYKKPATVSIQADTVFKLFLPNHIREQMGGESIAYFAGRMDDKKPMLVLRVPAPKPAWT